MRLLSHNADADDGADVRKFFSREVKKPDATRPLRRLQASVMRCVTDVLMGELRDPLLRDLVVDGVVPAPDASRFRVTVVVDDARNREDVEEALRGAEPVFRAALAAALQRKRTPRVVFSVEKRGDAWLP